MLLKITRASLWNRRFAVALTVFTVAISVALLLAVERLRVETRNSCASTISGTDLIVGARTGPVQLLLYSVFRIGDASNNIRYTTYQELASLEQVAWAIPISLGDSHRGFRVLGTTPAYFEHFRYGDKRALQLASVNASSTKICCTFQVPDSRTNSAMLPPACGDSPAASCTVIRY